MITYPSFIATIERVVSVTDGDTVRLDYSYWTEQRPGMVVEVHEYDPKGEGIPCRLVLLDTPERKDKVGWAKARRDVLMWIDAWRAAERELEMEVWLDGRGGFGRPLVDIYVRGARDVTLSQHMLALGWSPYLEDS